jgi:hypothetical protein
MWQRVEWPRHGQLNHRLDWTLSGCLINLLEVQDYWAVNGSHLPCWCTPERRFDEG